MLINRDKAIAAVEGLKEGAINTIIYDCALDEALQALRSLPTDDGWEDIATAPKGITIIGLRDPQHTGRQPAFVGELYDMVPNALIDVWSGKWAVCTHWKPLGPLPAPPAC